MFYVANAQTPPKGMRATASVPAGAAGPRATASVPPIIRRQTASTRSVYAPRGGR